MEGYILNLNGMRVVFRHIPGNQKFEVLYFGNEHFDDRWSYSFARIIAIREKRNKCTMTFGYAKSRGALMVVKLKLANREEYDRLIDLFVRLGLFVMREDYAYAGTICGMPPKLYRRLEIPTEKRLQMGDFLYMVEHDKNRKWYKSSSPIVTYKPEDFAEKWIH